MLISDNFLNFFNLTIECLHLFTILSQENLLKHILCADEYLSNYPFYRFINSMDMIRNIIKQSLNNPKLSNQHLKMLISHLSTSCPHYFNYHDQLHYQAKERLMYIKQAKSANLDEKIQIHNQALAIYYQSCNSLHNFHSFNLYDIIKNLCNDGAFYKDSCTLIMMRYKCLCSYDSDPNRRLDSDRLMLDSDPNRRLNMNNSLNHSSSTFLSG